jgi:hypothetical protein
LSVQVVKYRLLIRRDSQPPAVWFKDEGGRDKCIEVAVDLVDAEGRRVTGQEVPLKVSLLYEDMLPVTKQDILKLSSDSRQCVDATGMATLRLRIEDVSKNHQSKGFVIKVGPDTQQRPMTSDISPDISTSVNVRSKRNRRNKNGRVDDESLVGHALAMRTPCVDLSLPVSQHPLVEANPLLAAPAVVDTGDGSPVLKALSNVIGWTRTVVNGLYQIQWQLIGYESAPDGSPDISRPLFNVHNPNTIVGNILDSYRLETMENLRFLARAVEPGTGTGTGAAAGLGAAAGAGAAPAVNGGGAYAGAHTAGAGFGPGPGPGGMFVEGPGSLKGGMGLGVSMGSQGYGAAPPPAGSGGGLSAPSSCGDLSEPPPLGMAFQGYGHHQAPVPQPAAPHSQPASGGGPHLGGFSGGVGGSGGALEHTSSMGSTGGSFGSSMSLGPATPSGPHAAAVAPAAPPGVPGVGVGGYLGPAVPSLARGRTGQGGSDYPNISMVPLMRESTYDLLSNMEWFTFDQESTPSLESQVFYVVAKVYCSHTYGELGFPAYDQKYSLVGPIAAPRRV